MTRSSRRTILTSGAAAAVAPRLKPRAAAPDRLAWWRDARFGMFIHFGVYSVIGRGEWVRNVESLSTEAYQPFVDTWNPVDFDPRAWARLARATGMSYAIMTAKHHDGFCLWDTALGNYKSTRTPAQRDLVREYLDAFRAEGLKVGLYYSLLDWHHPEYPHFGDKHHPMRADPGWKGRTHDLAKYLTYMHGQVKELVTKYGRIDLMWFDFSYENMTAEVWKATELLKMVRGAQPHIILNNRLSASGGHDDLTYGDYQTPEQGIPEKPMVDAQGRPQPWETCLTLNNSWGYNRKDVAWKGPEQIVHALVEAVSKGGNVLLNVGPDGRGRIPTETVSVFESVGGWMNRNGASIRGCGPSELTWKPDWGRFTQRGKTLYAHVLQPPIGHLALHGLRDRVKRVTLLRDGAEAATATTWWERTSGDALFVNVAKPIHYTYPMPDPWDTVFAIELA